MEPETVINVCFHLGLRYTDILQCLFHMTGVSISLITLKRTLKRSGLFRRKNKSPISDVAIFLSDATRGYMRGHGYKIMHQVCIENGFCVTQETVRLLLGIIDPGGVALRTKKGLVRRTYVTPGPNFIWHLDSYDKLKPYGVCINGAIDGFSRNMVWLEAYSTNSDPKVIANYFMETVKSVQGCPMRIRGDRGTENGHVEQMLLFLRSDHTDAYVNKCFIYGSSNQNQRIERWWGYLRKHHIHYWLNTFETLKDENLFDGSFLDKSLIQFCFMNQIQRELEEVRTSWNHHKIRRSKNDRSPFGRPIVMYRCPQVCGCVDYLCNATQDKVNICLQQCTPKNDHTCEKTIFELCCLLMADHQLKYPQSTEEGIHLYTMLREKIQKGLAEYQ